MIALCWLDTSPYINPPWAKWITPWSEERQSDNDIIYHCAMKNSVLGFCDHISLNISNLSHNSYKEKQRRKKTSDQETKGANSLSLMEMFKNHRSLYAAPTSNDLTTISQVPQALPYTFRKKQPPPPCAPFPFQTPFKISIIIPPHLTARALLPLLFLPPISNSQDQAIHLHTECIRLLKLTNFSINNQNFAG